LQADALAKMRQSLPVVRRENEVPVDARLVRASLVHGGVNGEVSPKY
jgi:hypothetical protein